MIQDLVNPQLLAERARLRREFTEAQPFKHLVMDGFLNAEFAEQMLQEFPDYDSAQAMNENGAVGLKATHDKVKDIGPAYRRIDALVQSEAFRGFIAEITGIEDLRYDPYYFGGGTHNNMEGQDLDPHVDFTTHPITEQHRRLNLIVYLNKEWDGAWGGNIEFHKNPRLHPDADEIISVEPLFNRAVIFETNNISWHGFPRIELPADKKNISRKSFAIYYYTEQREERVKPHSTIYVERHLSDRFQPGMTLQAQDLQEIKTLLTRRDQHLERLYNNISHLMGEAQSLQTGQSPATDAWDETPDSSMGLDRAWQRLQAERQLLRAEIQALKNSTSWKITAPLRRLKRWMS